MDRVREREFMRRLLRLRERAARMLLDLTVFRESRSGSGSSPEVESHREYSPGDDPRYIDWHLYARLDRFFVKSTVKEEEGMVHVLLDTSESMRTPFAEKMERAEEVSIAIAHLALCGGNRVVPGVWGERLLKIGEPVKGEGQIPRVLKFFEQAPRSENTDLVRSLGNLTHLPTAPDSWVVLVSDFIDSGDFWPGLDRLRSFGVCLGAVQLLHPDEVSPRVTGNLLLEDPETGQSLGGLFGYRPRQHLRAAAAEFLRDTQTAFNKRSARFLLGSTQRRFEDIVLDFMTAAGALGNSC